ncbi:MAG: polyprenyl synthetase family protein [Bdellovibrionales bacterium]|nr:polyprenyl synthetase family protein [Bdellovibrionales bacterium]
MIDLLDRQDLKKQPLELRRICEKIFSKGKEIRPQLVVLVSKYLGLKKSKQLFLARLVEYIHNSSLLHDDFIDQSKRRHNSKTAWLEFSPTQAILVGDYLLAKVIIYLAQEKNLELLTQTAQVICNLAQGEFLQRQFLDFKNKSFHQRNQVSELKTASLFKWCLKAPFIYKNRKSKKLYSILDKIGYYMGLLFQRSDDLIDFNIRNKDNKSYLVDIKESYFNSFSCFLLKQSNSKQEEALKNLSSLSSIYKIFSDFDDQVKAFDSLNKKLILKVEKILEQELKPLLKQSEKNLVVELKKRISFFYWRNNKE